MSRKLLATISAFLLYLPYTPMATAQSDGFFFRRKATPAVSYNVASSCWQDSSSAISSLPCTVVTTGTSLLVATIMLTTAGARTYTSTSDSGGCTPWTTVTGILNTAAGGSGQKFTQIYCAGATAGTHTVTVVISGTQTFTVMWLEAINGVSAPVAASVNGASSTIIYNFSGTAITPTAVGEVLYSVQWANGGAFF